MTRTFNLFFQRDACMLFQKPFTIKVKKGFLHMNGITLALIRFWQNKQISLPPMSTLLIAAGIMFFCFWVVTSQNKRSRKNGQRLGKMSFRTWMLRLQPHRFVNTFPVGQIRQSFIFWGTDGNYFRAGRCWYSLFLSDALDADRSSHLASAFRQVIFAAL